jgi:mevalonate kinase
MQTERLLQQQPDSGSAVHAVTTPAIKTLLQVRAKTYMGWITKAHGAGRGACTL